MSTTNPKSRSPEARSPQASPTGAVPAKGRHEPEVSGLGGCLVRLCWMAFGNFALILIAVRIATMRGVALSVMDLAFWGTVALLIAVRYWDISKLKGLTVMYQPATMPHWRRYAIGLTLVSLAVWALAHWLAR